MVVMIGFRDDGRQYYLYQNDWAGVRRRAIIRWLSQECGLPEIKTLEIRA